MLAAPQSESVLGVPMAHVISIIKLLFRVDSGGGGGAATQCPNAHALVQMRGKAEAIDLLTAANGTFNESFGFPGGNTAPNVRVVPMIAAAARIDHCGRVGRSIGHY